MRSLSQTTQRASAQSHQSVRARRTESALCWIGVFTMLADAVSKNRHAFAGRHDSKTFAEQGHQS